MKAWNHMFDNANAERKNRIHVPKEVNNAEIFVKAGITIIFIV